MLLTGPPFAESIKFGIVFTLQFVGGFLIWTVISNGNTSIAESLGFGCVLGALSSLISSQLLRSTPLSGIGWLAPSLIAVVVVAPRLSRHHSPRFSKSALREVLWVSIISIAGFLPLAAFWISNPAKITDWTAYFGDIPYHEAIAKSLTNFGPSDTIFVPGDPLHYHWFADAWAGTVSSLASLGPYVGTTRAIYVFAIFASVCLVWAWAKRLSQVKAAPVIASLALVLACFIGLGVNNSYSMFVTDISPTHTFAIPVGLALALICTELMSRRLPKSALMLVIVLSGATLASRAPIAMVGLVALTTSLVAMWARAGFGRVFAIVACSLIGYATAYILVISGGPPNGLGVELNTFISNTFGFVPFSTPLGQILGYLSMCAAVSAPWLGLAILLQRAASAQRAALWWAVGSTISGLVFVVVLAQPGRGQISFLWASAIFVLPISGIGVAEGIEVLRKSRSVGDHRITKRLVAVCVFGCLVGLIGLFNAVLTKDFVFGGYLRWIFPFAAWTSAFIVSCLVFTRAKSAEHKSYVLAASAIVLMVAAICASVTASVIRVYSEERVIDSATPLAISPDDVEAASWLDARVPLNEVVATNRQCGDVSGQPPECGSISYVVSSLTGRRVLIEGYSYAVVPLTDWARDRIDLSWKFGLNPDLDSLSRLWNEGVRWIWIDRKFDIAESWIPFGDVRYQNPTVALVELRDPAMIRPN